MQIVLSLRPTSPADLVLIELQGVLERRDDPDGGFAGETLGKIRFAAEDVDMTSPELIIGNHRLQGKLVPYPKPFAAIKRVAASSSLFGGGPSDEHSPHEWAVLGIVRHRFVFKTRPQIIV